MRNIFITLLFVAFSTVGVLADTTEAFVTQAVKEAQYIKKQYGIPVSATVAQAIYESNYGRSPLAKKYNNFHGLKVGEKKYKGNRALVRVKEEGRYICAEFRAFGSMHDGFVGYAQFLKRRRYEPAFNTKDGLTFVKTILRCGYCPSDEYLTDIKRIMVRHNLRKLDV